MNVCFLYSKVEGVAEELDSRLEMSRNLEDTFAMDVLTKRHDLSTVGELYDFLCERGLSNDADFILR